MLKNQATGVKYPFCRDVSAYQLITKIGQGTFGEVFKAQEKETRKYVALKKILMDNEKEGFPITALREIKILQKLKDDNVVPFIEVCRSCSDPKGQGLSTFYLVFEFCDHDLAGLLSNSNIRFQLGELKMIMKQLMFGLYKIHAYKIIHRDIKASNILITKKGVLKIADFGLARPYSTYQKTHLTNRVVTLWYRPPELLLGARDYGPEIDMWGVGCVMAELWTRTPILQGACEQHQLMLITQLCGSITPETFPGVENLELYNKMSLKEGQKRKVVERLRGYIRDSNALDLIDKLLTLDPKRRIDCDQALNHDFLWTDPMPADLSKIMSQINVSMFELTAAKRKIQGQQPQKKMRIDDQYRDVVF